MSFDVSEAAELLNIVEKCAGHSGKLGHLSNAAMGRLLEINKQIADQARKSETVERINPEPENGEQPTAVDSVRRI
jgi:hypothetical protein